MRRQAARLRDASRHRADGEECPRALQGPAAALSPRATHLWVCEGRVKGWAGSGERVATLSAGRSGRASDDEETTCKQGE